MSEMITLEEIEAIEARAVAAAPGPWRVKSDAFDSLPDVFSADDRIAAYCGGRENPYRAANAAHIAGMDPAATLRFCAALRALMGYLDVKTQDVTPEVQVEIVETCAHGIRFDRACPYCAEEGMMRAE